ncbi:MAG: sugar phosphate isomerase/epimerase [Brevinematales bacterium]|nr:sugar phosphate isomerase/epimerase [Brevinematales bacterium]
MRHPPFGLKVWSTNCLYEQPIRNLWQEEVMQFLEIYVLPGTGEKTALFWRRLHQELHIPMIVHVPHYSHGLCLACRDREGSNRLLMEESLRFADHVEADMVIVHPGVNGDIMETARQIRLFWDERLLLENKPRYGNGENLLCNGALPEEIALVMEETGVRFCLDIGHAITAANGFGLSPWEMLTAFFALRPSLLHLTDGHWNGVLDEHLHFGEGDFPIEEIVARLFSAGLSHLPVTNEAYKKSEESLDDFREDMGYLSRLFERLGRDKTTMA